MNTTKEIIAIIGPTASGKTRMAVEIAKRINAEIISCDSRQVYRYLDIGTNKDGTWDERSQSRAVEGIPQYLTDIINPDERYDAGQFRENAQYFIEKIISGQKRVIVAGGTGLYLRALTKGLAPMPPSDDRVRQSLMDELSEKGIDHLYSRLMKVDPITALINKNNTHRIIRALEVFELTGTPISKLHEKTPGSKYKFRIFGLDVGKEVLIKRINERTTQMITRGLVEEARGVLEKGYDSKCPGMEGIGYRSCVKHLNGLINANELAQEISVETRQYAKRQLTWFRKEADVAWLNADNLQSNFSFILESILKSLEI